MEMLRFFILAVCLGAFALPAPDALASEKGPRGKIEADYSVSLAALPLGNFRLTADLDGADYQLRARGRFQLLAGLLYRATGNTMSRGTLTSNGPEPERFIVNFTAGKNKEQRRMRFADGGVRDVTLDPNRRPNRRAVPVTEEQLVDVLDPLTAGFLSARSNNHRDPLAVCDQTVPVYDGRQRFDIALSPKRTENLGADAPGGLRGRAAVCQARFIPVGGHRPDHAGIKYMSSNEEIEVWLVRVPETELYLPYRITMPTAYGNGSAILTEAKFDLRRRTASP
jgi:hypothetical protein